MARKLAVGRFLVWFVIAGCSYCFERSAHASDPTTPGGYLETVCRPGSDTIVSVPLRREAVFAGTLASDPVVSGNTATLAIAGSPGFSQDEFTQSAHVLTITGASARSGYSYAISGNSVDTISVDLSEFDVAGVAAGEKLIVFPMWTLDTLFPPETQRTLHTSSGPLFSQRGSELLFFDRDQEGIDLAPDRVYFLTSEGWFQSARGFPAAGGSTISPGSAFVIRHRSGAPETNFAISGQLIREKRAFSLKTNSDKPQDTLAGLTRPLRVTLQGLGLDGNAFRESASVDPADRLDELHVFENTLAAINRQPSAVYFKVEGEWREDFPGYPQAETAFIEAGAGLMIRKAATTGGETHVWLNTPDY